MLGLPQLVDCAYETATGSFIDARKLCIRETQVVESL